MKILRYFSLLFLLLCGCKGPQFTADTGYDGVRNNSNKPISNTNIGDQNSQNNPYTNNIGANTGITIPNSYFPIGSYVQPLPNYYISNQGQPTTPSNNNIGNQTQPVPSEKIVYINQICRPVDIPSRNISGVKLKVYSTNGNFIKEISTASLMSSIMNQKQLPMGIFRDLPDGYYTIMICSANGTCSNPVQSVSSIAANFNMYNRDLSTTANEPVDLLKSFGNLPDANDGRIGGIPVLQIQNGMPVVPAKAGAPSTSLFSKVRQLGSVASNSMGLFSGDCLHSPLMIELSEKKIELSSQEQGVDFDVTNNGHKERISWPVNHTTNLLVLDRNGNGVIDNINELFGNNTKDDFGKAAANGFEALSKYDLNFDGKINSYDLVFNQLRLWSDLNRNGRTDLGELKTLINKNIFEISLNYTHKDEYDQYGNIAAQRASVTMNNGQEYKIYDIWFSPKNIAEFAAN